MNWTADKQSKRAVSDCGRYVITWAQNNHGTYYNSWYGDSPRKHLHGGYDKEVAKTVCEQHQRRLDNA